MKFFDNRRNSVEEKKNNKYDPDIVIYEERDRSKSLVKIFNI